MKRRRYVIPTNDREIFIDPPINHVHELIHSNKSKFSTYDFNICGIPFQKFRDAVRHEVLQKAIEYTRQITPENPPIPPLIKVDKRGGLLGKDGGGFGETIIQTGYQPTFYHPGIWIKNHLAYHIAKRVNGISINLCIDNDVCHGNWICVPRVDGQEVALEKIEFVKPCANLAFEELSFYDTNKLIYFKNKVLACLNRHDMLETFEQFANFMIDASKRTSNAGEILTISRRKFEDTFGIYNLELPVSKICESDSFLIFFLTILLDCQRFVSSYNYRLERYRKANKLRSKAQPLPDLQVNGNTVELPFWAWSRGGPRKRLFAQCVDNRHINLIYENETVSTFAPSPYPSPSRGEGRVGVWRLDAHLAKLKELFNSGIKLRPRAITNTMFSRLFFSDVFIHGIGGARYDVITDSLIKDFFGVEPPNFLTASATLYLPFNPPYSPFNKGGKGGFTIADLRAHRLLLRDMHYNPERYLPPHLKMNEEIKMLIMEKQKMIDSADGVNHEGRLYKFKRIREINSFVVGKLLPYLQQKEAELKQMERLISQNEIMRNRAYPFCIYPESLLKDFYGERSLLSGW